MNLLTDPGFELGTGWTYTGSAQRTNAFGANTGSYAVRLIASDFGPIDSTVYETGLSLTIGTTYYVSAYVNNAETQTGPLVCRVDPGSGLVELARLEPSHVAAGWRFWNIGSFVAAGTTGTFWLETTTGEGTWYADDAFCGASDTVAIQLAERAIDAIVTTLKANLAGELTAIEGEWGDGTTLPAPGASDYYKYPRPEVAGARVQVEVFEQAFEIINPYTDAAANRAVYQIPVTVRLTAFNSDGASPDKMMKRMRRYGAALMRVGLEQYTLGGSDAAIQVSVPTSYVPMWEFEGENSEKVRKIQVTVPLRVRCEEVA